MALRLLWSICGRTTRTDKHGRVFQVTCKTWLAQYTLLQQCTAVNWTGHAHFTRYYKNMYNWSPVQKRLNETPRCIWSWIDLIQRWYHKVILNTDLCTPCRDATRKKGEGGHFAQKCPQRRRRWYRKGAPQAKFFLGLNYLFSRNPGV